MAQVSIIMPVKNASPFLADCLKSIRNQSYTDWELIAIDDHSMDPSRAILESFRVEDPRIHVLSNTGSGIIPALQKALQDSNGIYITRMDADDLMPADRLEKMIQVLEKSPQRTIVTGLVNYFSAKPVSKGYRQYEAWINEGNLTGRQWENIYRECVIASPNWLIRKTDLLAVSGFDDLDYPEDYHLVLRWYQNGFTIKTIPETTLLWREHPDRTSRNSEHYAQQAFFELKLRAFLETDYRGGELVIWGENQKTKLTRIILERHNIPYLNLEITDYQKTASLWNPQVLIGVYPSAMERQKIEQYLRGLGLLIGKDYWYL